VTNDGVKRPWYKAIVDVLVIECYSCLVGTIIRVEIFKDEKVERKVLAWKMWGFMHTLVQTR